MYQNSYWLKLYNDSTAVQDKPAAGGLFRGGNVKVYFGLHLIFDTITIILTMTD